MQLTVLKDGCLEFNSVKILVKSLLPLGLCLVK